MAKFLINNLIDTTTLSTNVGNLVPTLPVENLKDISKAKVARSNGTSPITIYGEFTTPGLVNAFILGNHNFQAGVTYQLYLYSSSDWTGVPLVYSNQGEHTVTADQAAVNTDEFQYNLPIWIYEEGYPDVSLYPGSFKINIGNATNMHYFQIGRLFTGEAVEPKVGAALGNTLSWKETTKQFRTEDGTLRSDIIIPSKIIEFSLNTINDSDRVELQRMFAYVGRRLDFYISLFPGSCVTGKELDYSGIVKLTKIPRYTEFAQNYYSAKYAVEEI